MTRTAAEQHDWFKFETRIRSVMKEMLEISVLRSKEIETDSRKMVKKYEKLEKKIDEQSYSIDKLNKMISS
jgi:chromosome segregation ATPase